METWLSERLAKAIQDGEAQSLGVVAWRAGDLEINMVGASRAGGTESPTEDSVYALGSVTKPYTAMAVLRLVVEGTLQLDGPVADWIPSVAQHGDVLAERLTVRHLLTHCCGLTGDWFVDRDPGIPNSADSLAEVARRLPEVPLMSAPGKRYSYSNLGMVLAGRLLEVVTSLSYERAMHELVLDPLRLHGTGFTGEPPVLEHSVPSHNRIDGRPNVNSWQPNRDDVRRTDVPSGGLFTSPRDLARWLQCHLTEGASTDQPGLWGRVVRMMREPQPLVFGPKRSAVGVGWSMVAQNPLVLRHGGDMIGFLACCALAPERGCAVGVLSNVEGSAGVMVEVERRLIEEVTGPVYVPPLEVSSDVALGSYVGNYEVPPDRQYRIDLRDGQLSITGGVAGSDSPTMPATGVRVIAPNWGVLERSAAWPMIVPFELGPDGQAEWVTIGGRAARRVQAIPAE